MTRRNKSCKPLDMVCHLGVFRKRISLFEAISLLVAGTIGAGVLGIPFVIAKIGVWLGMLYILVIGMLMIGINLLIGEISVRTGRDLQLVGLAKEYLGNGGAACMTLLVYIMLIGVLVVYIIGEGQTLSELFGGSPFVWSTAFFLASSIFIYIGLRTIKRVELLLSMGILLVVIVIALLSAPFISYEHYQYTNLAELLLPYGVLLFAFHGTTIIPEAYSLLRNKEERFKTAIVTGGVVTIIVYALFAVVVVGVTGQATTEIATVGLGRVIGPAMFIAGNIFAALAIATSYLMAGVALKDSLRWDYKLSNLMATVLVCGIPFLLFLFGVRGFIATIDIVGGVVMSLEMLLILLIFWKAKQRGDMTSSKYKLHHSVFILIALLIALAIGAVYSFVKLF